MATVNTLTCSTNIDCKRIIEIQSIQHSLVENENVPTLCEIMMVENQLLIPRVQSSKDSTGKIISNSLENMFPYLTEEEMKEVMS